MQWRFADLDDAHELAVLNGELIADEGHRNPMGVQELERRMARWLEGEYRAVLFQTGTEVAAYAVFRDDEQGRVHLRQFYVVRHLRRRGFGHDAFRIFRTAVVPEGKRIVLEVLTANRGALAFWRAMGFTDYAITLERLPGEEPDTT
jgi:ribosomal protein S18 acetylase RimI-like enzyme